MRRFILSVCAIAIAASARADWPVGGTLVCSPGDVNGVRNAVIMDLPSGDLGVLGVGNGGNSNYYQFQRISRDGVVAPGWPAVGVSLYFVLKGTPLSFQGLATDDSGFVWHDFSNSHGTQAVRVGPTGDAGGTDLTPLTVVPLKSQSSRVTQAPNGDAFVCSGNGLKRITRTGTAAAGWTSTGITLPNTSYEDTAILPDGAGGVIVFMRSSSATSAPVAERIDGNGSVHTGWPAGGVQLCSPPAVFGPTDYDSRLIASGPDHFIAVWTFPTTAPSPIRELRLQRFGLDGTLDPAWPSEGLSPFAPDTLDGLSLVPDGSGGVYILRAVTGTQLGTHVTAAGTLLGTIETSLLQPGDRYVPVVLFPAGSPPDAVIADRTPNGGLLVGWNDTRLSPTVSFRLRWWSPDLTPDPSKPDTGLVVFPGSPHPYAGDLLAVHADGTDGAFVAWSDYHDIGFGQISGDLWMARVQIPATTGVAPRPGASHLALSAPRPNPARGSVALDVALPEDSPARVELLDVAGRVLRTQHVQGAGAHAVSFAELGALEPGLYFVRVTSRVGGRSSRFVLTR